MHLFLSLSVHRVARALSLRSLCALSVIQGDPACKGLEPVMHVVYAKRPVPGVFEDFSNVRARVNREWASVVCVVCVRVFVLLALCPLSLYLPPPLSSWPLILACSLSCLSATQRQCGGGEGAVHTHTPHASNKRTCTQTHTYSCTRMYTQTHIPPSFHSSLLPLSSPLLSRRAATRYHHHCKPKSMTSCGLAAGLSTNVRLRKRSRRRGGGEREGGGRGGGVR